MKFAQTITMFVTSLPLINIAFSIPLASKTDSVDLNLVGGVAASNKASNCSTGAEGNLQMRQSQMQLQGILNDMDSVISYLGANDRADFTQKLVVQLFQNNPGYSYVVCHVAHDYSFDGTEGVDWAHYKTKFHKYQYDIVIGGGGVFTRYGDGGYTNWAYSKAWVSKVVQNDGGSTTVTFF